MTATSLELPGLDAQNPLAFLAALGVLRVLDDAARTAGGSRPCLRFRLTGRTSPIIESKLADSHGLIDAILQDAAARATSPVLRLAYDDAGNAIEPDARGASRDLKPPPKLASDWLGKIAARDDGEAQLAGAFLSDAAQDNNGASKPTAFDFTAGQQRFLRMVETLRAQIDADDVREALMGPWIGASTLPSLMWDATAPRNYALRAGDPSGEKPSSIPAANWLGVLGLSFLPVFPSRGRLSTTGVQGGWKTSQFTWPVWSAGATASVVRSLLTLDFQPLTQAERAVVGIEQVFAARILRADQGGRGSFAPARIVPAAGRGDNLGQSPAGRASAG